MKKLGVFVIVTIVLTSCGRAGFDVVNFVVGSALAVIVIVLLIIGAIKAYIDKDK